MEKGGYAYHGDGEGDVGLGGKSVFSDEVDIFSPRRVDVVHP